MTNPDYAKRDHEATEDRAEAAEKWRRGYFQLRGSFVQAVDASAADRRGPLAGFVNDRQYRALVLYLMLISVWPWQSDAKVPLEAHVWMNLLHSRDGSGRSLVWSESTLSRTWKYLAKRKLITKKRGRLGRLYVAPRLEDGTGTPYTFPSGEKGNREESYFTVPDRFWLAEEFAALNLPGIALLLILAKETNGKKAELRITQEQIAQWYGISRATVAKGLAELRTLGVLEERVEWIPAKLSKIRTTSATYYSLQEEYSTAARAKARASAERSRRRAARRMMPPGPSFAADPGEGGDPVDTRELREVEDDQ